MGKRSRPEPAGSRRAASPAPGDVDWVRPTQLAIAATVVFGPLRFTATADRAREVGAGRRADHADGSGSDHPVLLQ